MRKYPEPEHFTPRYTEKYKGSLPIVARSSWEMKAFRFLDLNPNVLKWGSESVVVLYQDPTRPDPYTGKPSVHRYFIDLNMTMKDKFGKLHTYLVEIKPESQYLKPVQGKKKSKTFLNESVLWIRNVKKWEAATKFAKSKGWEFIILTEKEIGPLNY